MPTLRKDQKWKSEQILGEDMRSNNLNEHQTMCLLSCEKKEYDKIFLLQLIGSSFIAWNILQHCVLTALEMD